MALVPCPECGREVSTLAAACPHCGAPLRDVQPAEKTSAGTVAAGTFGGIAGCVFAPVAILLGLLLLIAMCQP